MITSVAASLAVLAYFWYTYRGQAMAGHQPHPVPFQLAVDWFLPAAFLLLAMLALVHLARRWGRPRDRG